MLKHMIVAFLVIISGACGGSGASGNLKIEVNQNAVAWVSDAEQNDNYTLLETVCEQPNQVVTANLYFKSELHGNAKIIWTDFYIPDKTEWVAGQFRKVDGPSSCGAPGIRACNTSDLSQAKADCIPGEYLYGCGSDCTYTLVSSVLSQ